MKIEKKTVEPEFVPVVITLETQKEADAMYALFINAATAGFVRSEMDENFASQDESRNWYRWRYSRRIRQAPKLVKSTRDTK